MTKHKVNSTVATTQVATSRLSYLTQSSRFKLCLMLGLLSGLVGSSMLLTGCGFQLRGYGDNNRTTSTSPPLSKQLHHTALLTIGDDATALPLKLALTRQLSGIGINVVEVEKVDAQANKPTTSTSTTTSTIDISHVRLQKYELVGVLTEVRLVLSANVSYQVIKNNQPVTINSPIQVEQSYQLNKASVSVTDKQGEQIKEELYQNLASRITD